LALKKISCAALLKIAPFQYWHRSDIDYLPAFASAAFYFQR